MTDEAESERGKRSKATSAIGYRSMGGGGSAGFHTHRAEILKSNHTIPTTSVTPPHRTQTGRRATVSVARAQMGPKLRRQGANVGPLLPNEAKASRSEATIIPHRLRHKSDVHQTSRNQAKLRKGALVTVAAALCSVGASGRVSRT